jgi:hypothetical protein
MGSRYSPPGGGTGDITGVTITTDSGGGSKATDTAGSADFSVLGGAGIDVTNSGATVTVAGETASDSNAGIVELATTAETTTGTDTGRAVTPDAVKDADHDFEGNVKARVGQLVTVSGAGDLTLATHGGAYTVVTGNVLVDLPAGSENGQHFVIVATHGSGCTVATKSSQTINGANADPDNSGSAVSVAQYKAKTFIYIGSNAWVAIG